MSNPWMPAGCFGASSDLDYYALFNTPEREDDEFSYEDEEDADREDR